VLVGGLPHDGILAAVEENPAPRWLWLRPKFTATLRAS
jgi:hypothetical protein